MTECGFPKGILVDAAQALGTAGRCQEPCSGPLLIRRPDGGLAAARGETAHDVLKPAWASQTASGNRPSHP